MGKKRKKNKPDYWGEKQNYFVREYVRTMSKALLFVIFTFTLTTIIMIFISGCAKTVIQTSIPKSLFQEKSVLERTEITNEGQILEEYLKLYESYQKNLYLLETIESMNDKFSITK